MFNNNQSLKNRLSHIKLFEYNVLYILNFLFIASSLTLISISDYKIYDTFWTPLRSLYRALNNDFWFANPSQVINYVYDTVHNEALK